MYTKVDYKMKLEKEKQKMQYEPPSIEIILFATEDILATSGTGDPGYDPGIDLPLDPFDPIES